MTRLVIPLLLFLGMVVLLASGIGNDPSKVPSPLVGRPAPNFELPMLKQVGQRISRDQLLGQAYVLNVWASWCPGCQVEHDVITDLAQSDTIPVYGLNWKDTHEMATRWLDHFGDPYSGHAFDESGDVAIEFGVYGAPETFVIDAEGIVRYKYIGPVTPEVLATEIFPIIAQVQSESS